MVSVLQVLGIAYLACMLYLTFLYYKRNNYSVRSFIFWVVVWVGGIILLIIPTTISSMTQQLDVARTIDFYLIIGLMFFSGICFMSYATVQKNEQRIEKLVREMAKRKN